MLYERQCSVKIEDVAVEDNIAKAGQILKAARLSLLAAVGLHDVSCTRRPTVAIFTSGDELQAPGQPLQAGQIYDSNRVLLQNLLIAEGLEPVAWPVLPDDPARIESALKALINIGVAICRPLVVSPSRLVTVRDVICLAEYIQSFTHREIVFIDRIAVALPDNGPGT